MQNLSKEETKRQDFVDNEIYDFVKRVFPSKREMEWKIEMIGDIRDTIQYWLVDRFKIVNELSEDRQNVLPNWY